MDKLAGSVERITFYNPENGYTVLRLQPETRGHQRLPGMRDDGLITVIGNMPAISPGEHLRLQGIWDNHPQHGKQFKVEICQQVLPHSIAGIESYLGSGLIKGIGPKLAERIVDQFGEETFDIIENQPQRISEISGIGAYRVGKIVRAWQEQKQVKEIMIFLHGYGVSTHLAVKIYKTYGDSALQIVQENPYQLERDIYGIGFITADRIAQALGLTTEHPARIEAGIVYVLNAMISEGHVYTPKAMLIAQASELLEVSADLIAPGLERLVLDDRIHEQMLPATDQAEDIAAIYLTPFYFGEKGVASLVKALVSAPAWPQAGKELSFSGENLSEEQQTAVRMALTHPVSILTGGPGTGKTTCLKALITTLEKQGIRYALASPTGRAAKRLSEATGQPASTIHRLLEFSPAKGFKRDKDNPLKVDFLVVDEASMLDLLLTNHLLKAIRPGTHVLFVGDVDQLPPVGAGDVLRDLIKSELLPVTRLQTIFRQAAGSEIISNAHRINQNQMPIFSKEDGDFFLFPAEDAAAAAAWIVDIVSERIPQKFGFDALTEIQVLSPLYRGPAGVTALNERLQEKINPAGNNTPECKLFGTTYRVGDKVMQTRNNYDKDVFNGDLGFIRAMDKIENTLHVDFEDRLVEYEWSDVDELTLAYVVSVHKSQGSEFPVIVMPIVTQHYAMLQRNLFYTAITRARNLCVLAGNRKAISIAVHNNKVAKRFSALDWRLGKNG